PSRPPPFPYTTLFRSHLKRRRRDRPEFVLSAARRAGCDRRAAEKLLDRQPENLRELRRPRPIFGAVCRVNRRAILSAQLDDRPLDRKSTRLNSSHLGI